MLQIVKRKNSMENSNSGQTFHRRGNKKCSASLAVKDLQIRTTKKVLFYTHPNSKDRDAGKFVGLHVLTNESR